MDGKLLRSKSAKKITLIGFWINTILAIFKISAGIIGNSGAMIADGIHSLSDFLTDVVILISFKFAEKPEDNCHNYGHDKFETIATASISIFLAIVGFNILKSGTENIIYVIQGNLIEKPKYIALLAAIISIIMKEFLFRYTYYVGKNIDSSTIIANAWHHRSDALSSICVLIGIAGAIVLGDNWTILDPIASIIVSILIFKVSFEILLPALSELTETSLKYEERELIAEILDKHKEVKGYHNLRSRRHGNKAIIEMHIFVSENLNIKSAHNISTEIEFEIKKVFGNTSIITVHIEPYDKSKVGKDN